jgi:hypothetical protein
MPAPGTAHLSCEAPMASTISGSNAISNLSGSDTDFDTVLANLKKVESTQLNRLTAWKSDWKLRYDAFDKVIEQSAPPAMCSQPSPTKTALLPRT